MGASGCNAAVGASLAVPGLCSSALHTTAQMVFCFIRASLHVAKAVNETFLA